MSKGRMRKTYELDQVANTAAVSPKPIAPEYSDRAWANMRVPKLNRTTGTWCWSEEWCTAYDELFVPLPLTGYILVPNKQRYIDPAFEEDLKKACKIGAEWASICARRAIQLGLAGWLARHFPACGHFQLPGRHVAGWLIVWPATCSVVFASRSLAMHQSAQRLPRPVRTLLA